MFHVPERWRNRTHPTMGTTQADGNNGAFDVNSPEPGWRLALICSDGIGWEHVSVHAYKSEQSRAGFKLRTPTWREMSHVKDLCWDDDDVVMQIHPRRSEYVNNHPHVLHLWRPTDHDIPTPPTIAVGIPGETLNPYDAAEISRAGEVFRQANSSFSKD